MSLKPTDQEARLVSDLPLHFGVDKNLMLLTQMEPQTPYVPQPSHRHEMNVQHLTPHCYEDIQGMQTSYMLWPCSLSNNPWYP
jgi:hypothetical protein